jgi:hypothetical protein
MKKRLTNIKGQHVAFTGFLWCDRSEFQRKLKRAGAIPTPKGRVNRDTTVLVRGKSGVWKFGDHGLKENNAAEQIRAGQQIAVVQDSEFQKLLEHGRPAKLLEKVAGQPIEWLVAPPERAFQRTAAIKGPLDREHSAKTSAADAPRGGSRTRTTSTGTLLISTWDDRSLLECPEKWGVQLGHHRRILVGLPHSLQTGRLGTDVS